MSSCTLTQVVGHLRRLAGLPEVESLPDTRLLASFTARHDETAFAALVKRPGPMVLGLCRQLRRAPPDAEGAFQAPFLVGARKAAAIARGELLANWLYGVAYRVAVRARAVRARRRAVERQGVEMAPARPS